MSAAEKGFITGGVIAHLKKGWAKFPFVGRLAHYWTEDTTTMEPTIGPRGRLRYYQSACRLLALSDDRLPALHPGNWPLCKRCERATKK